MIEIVRLIASLIRLVVDLVWFTLRLICYVLEHICFSLEWASTRLQPKRNVIQPVAPVVQENKIRAIKSSEPKEPTEVEKMMRVLGDKTGRDPSVRKMAEDILSKRVPKSA